MKYLWILTSFTSLFTIAFTINPFRLQMVSQADNGAYDFAYDTGDGAYHIQSRDNQGTVTGKFAYIDPEGHLREIDYKADDNGFHPSGDIHPKRFATKIKADFDSSTLKPNKTSFKPPQAPSKGLDAVNKYLQPQLSGFVNPLRMRASEAESVETFIPEHVVGPVPNAEVDHVQPEMSIIKSQPISAKPSFPIAPLLSTGTLPDVNSEMQISQTEKIVNPPKEDIEFDDKTSLISGLLVNPGEHKVIRNIQYFSDPRIRFIRHQSRVNPDVSFENPGFNPVKFENPRLNPVKFDNPELNPVKFDNPELNPVKFDNPELNPVKFDNPELNPVKFENPRFRPINFSNNPVKFDNPILNPELNPVKFENSRLNPVKSFESSRLNLAHRVPNFSPVQEFLNQQKFDVQQEHDPESKLKQDQSLINAEQSKRLMNSLSKLIVTMPVDNLVKTLENLASGLTDNPNENEQQTTTVKIEEPIRQELQQIVLSLEKLLGKTKLNSTLVSNELLANLSNSNSKTFSDDSSLKVHQTPILGSPLYTPVEGIREIDGEKLLHRTYVPFTRRYGYVFTQRAQ